MFAYRTHSFTFVTSLLLTFGVAVALSGRASANDAGIALGGTPSLLKGHPSVSMAAEKIQITVQKVHTRRNLFDRMDTVDCQFVFVNHGPACTVRMGFPDTGDGADDPDEESDRDTVMKTPPHTTFTSFRSYVEGTRVPTKLIRADSAGKYWHTKTVRFPAHSIVHIRDIYTQQIGGGISETGTKVGTALQVGYILHTGASWHGPIGRSEVRVTFLGDSLQGTPRPVPLSRVAKSDSDSPRGLGVKSTDVLAPGTVVWKGPCAPTVTGKTLRFVRTHWLPTEKDDIELTFHYK